MEKLRADPRIHPYRRGDFLYVRAQMVAHVRQRIRKRDLKSEERIGGVFDEFGAIDGGDHECGRGRIRTPTVVRGTAELLVQDGCVIFAKFFRGGRCVHADDDSIGMKEIVDGSAFAEEFRIRGDGEIRTGFSAVDIEGAF